MMFRNVIKLFLSGKGRLPCRIEDIPGALHVPLFHLHYWWVSLIWKR
jgi:hypothetical protein